MTKTKVFGTIIAVLVIVAGSIGGLTINEQKIALQEAINVIDVHSGVIEQLSGKLNELTTEKVNEPELITEEESGSIGISIKQECTPGPQPTTPAWDWTGNTQILNTWASKNKCTFALTWLSGVSEFVVYLDKPTVKQNQVHVWFKNQQAFGRLISNTGDQTLIYSLADIQVTKGVKNFDLAEVLNKGEKVEFHIYSTLFDGNYIDSVVIMDQ